MEKTFRQKLEEEYHSLKDDFSPNHIMHLMNHPRRMGKTMKSLFIVMEDVLKGAENRRERRLRREWIRKMLKDKRNLSDATLMVRYLKGPPDNT